MSHEETNETKREQIDCLLDDTMRMAAALASWLRQHNFGPASTSRTAAHEAFLTIKNVMLNKILDVAGIRGDTAGIRQAALDKLTKEEQTVLGIYR